MLRAPPPPPRLEAVDSEVANGELSADTAFDSIRAPRDRNFITVLHTWRDCTLFCEGFALRASLLLIFCMLLKRRSYHFACIHVVHHAEMHEGWACGSQAQSLALLEAVPRT